MSELLFTFAATCTRIEGDLTPIRGMERLADVLHPHGVSITWLVSPVMAEMYKDQLTKWHEEFGDDVGLQPTGIKAAPGFDLSTEQGKVDALAASVKEFRAGIQKILPWTKADVAFHATHDPIMLQAWEKGGFVGAWGYCFEQIEVDGITDRGIPWGFAYIDPRCRTAPNVDPRGLISMEWTARDLLKSYHSGNPTVWSTDINDVARSGLCRWRECDYLNKMFDEYHRNIRWNDLVVYQVHQEAHEMIPEFGCYSEEDCLETIEMLDELAAHVMAQRNVRSVSLSEAAAEYRKRYEETAPSFMLWRDIPVGAYNDDYSRGTPRGPWPKTFLYYDKECQMMFVDGGFEPTTIRNYHLRDYSTGKSQAAHPYFAEPVIPRVRLKYHNRSPWGAEIGFEIEAPRAMPMGVTFWEDWGPYIWKSGEGIIDHKIISGELMFLRMNVKEGKQDFVIHLGRK